MTRATSTSGSAKSTAKATQTVKARQRAEDQVGLLTWLHQRRDRDNKPLISAEELAAGNQLARDFHWAGMSPRVTASWNGMASSRRERRGPPGRGSDMSDHVVAARQRFYRALDAVGPEHAGLLVDACCFEKGLTEIEKSVGWPQRSAKVVLQIALSQLARHYGLISGETSRRPGEVQVRHWGAAGYRPEM